MHPYMERIFATLADRDPIDVLQGTPGRLEHLLERLGATGLERTYAPGKWPARDIYAHLADVELALAFRFRQALVLDRYAPEGFEQDEWARRYARLDPTLALEAFRGMRGWNLALFAGFDLHDWGREVRYPFEGVSTVDDMVRFLAGHDLNHLAQLERIVDAPAASA